MWFPSRNAFIGVHHAANSGSRLESTHQDVPNIYRSRCLQLRCSLTRVLTLVILLRLSFALVILLVGHVGMVEKLIRY